MKKIYLIVILIFAASLSFSQSEDYSWTALVGNPASFDSICNDYENYISTTYGDSIPESAKPAYKDYLRFKYFWQNRLAEVDGELSYLPYTEASVENLLNPICNDGDTADWIEIGPVSYPTQWLGLVNEVLYDSLNPDRIIISSDRGGIWIRDSSDGSWGWRNVTDDLRLPGLCASEIIRNPFDHDHLLASTASGILNSGDYGIGIIESFDNGENWAVLDSFPYQSAPFVQRIIYDPNDSDSTDGLSLYAISGKKIYYSSNSGSSWTQFSGPSNIHSCNLFHDIEIDDQGSIFLSTECGWGNYGQFFKYDGNQWIDLNSNSQFGNFQRVRITNPFNDTIFALIDGIILPDPDERRRLFRSTNYGSTWTFINTFGFPSHKYEFEYAPDLNVVFGGFLGLHIYDLNNNQQHFHDYDGYDFHADIRDFAILQIDSIGQQHLLATTDGGLCYFIIDTSDYGDDIEVQDLNGNYLPIGNFTGLGVSNQNQELIVSGAVHCNSFKYANSNWVKIGGGDGGDCEINWLTNTYYCQTNSSNWSNGNFSYSQPKWIIGLRYELHPEDPNKIYIGTGIDDDITPPRAQIVSFDQNLGLPVTEIPVPEHILAVGPIGIVSDSIFYCAEFSNKVYPNTPNRFVKTVDRGNTWEDLSFNNIYPVIGDIDSLSNVLRWKTISDIVINPIDKDELWITITGVWKENGVITDERFRVLHSTDAGASWYDYSDGLPAFPVECIEYQAGTNNRLFVGTDVGVFYRDDDMSEWQCFSEGLPVCLVTDLDYEPCNNTLYASTYGRGIFKCIIPFNDYVDNDTIEKGQYVTWDRSRIIFNNVIIPDSTTLYICANQYVHEDKKIIVERGGTLIVEDCKLTSRCDGFWQGIEVRANPDTTQMYDGLQGEVVLADAVIEHAKIGVLAGKINGTGWSYDYGYEGGIIKATNTSFIDNNLSASLLPYQNIHPISENEVNNTSGFRQCTFELTDAAADIDFDEFVYLAGVSGVKFKGCEFTNHTMLTDSPPAGNPGMGIYSISSMFYVTHDCINPNVSPCQEYQRCTFEGLTYGIKALGVYQQNNCVVEHSDFLDNVTGIYLSSMDNSAVNLNFFEFLVENQDTLNKFHCGLYLDNCTGYQVEENEFKSYYQIGNPVSSVGITVNNSGGNYNEIYNNYCHNLFAGILAQNENRANNGLTGLEILCNDFSTNEYDIAVTVDTIRSNSGIRSVQGSSYNSVTSPANNKFSYTHNNNVSDYYNDGNNITYWYAYDDGGYNLEPINYSNPEVNPLSNSSNTYTFSDSLGCPSSFSSGGSIEESRSSMNSAESSIDSTSNLLELLVDGGDTEALNTEVETSMPSQAQDLRDDLIENSPYLSDSVMVSAVEKENVLTEPMVTEILVANPQSAKSDTVQNALDNRFNQLSDEQRSDIDQGWFFAGAKETLESELGYHQSQRDRSFNNIIRIFSSDSLNIAPRDSIIAMLLSENSLNSKYNLVLNHLAKGEHSIALFMLDSIPTTFSLNADQSIQHQQFCNYVNMIIQLQNTKKCIFEIDSLQKILLYNMLDSAGVGLSGIARNILTDVDTLIYSEPYLLPGDGLKKGVLKRAPVKKAYSENSFKLYPNPAKEHVIIEYILKGEYPSGQLNIMDNRGIIVKSAKLVKSFDYKLIRTDDLPCGVYYCNFISKNESIQTIKLIISR